ncbi:uncharacterized protein EV422DRAFT_10869 [Fimicolochytrium jonesii]|uniref:uncharacterized protein n=1 Tax=Fimicolochytrium jonesii TaxID=1396493 RepID=UPI0022FF3007|nr:uncharacterized protein EV422DRAFT_10869 [Fimicolochytrium jonesii]KAI8826790.1 hypothetical protein EV422DRAFT_10869 [Fimicolochytrium jonesii]
MPGALHGAPENGGVPDLCQGAATSSLPGAEGSRKAGEEGSKEEEELLVLKAALRTHLGCFKRRRFRRSLRAIPGTDVVLTRVLGCGGYRLVIECRTEGSDRYGIPLAVRIPIRDTARAQKSRKAQLNSCAATSGFCEAVGIPAPLLIWPRWERPVPSHDLPPHAAIFAKTTGKPLHAVWPGAPVELKERILLDFADLQMRILAKPFRKLRGLRLSPNGEYYVGALFSDVHDQAIRLAGAHAVNVGPYLHWEEYAYNQVQALSIVLSHTTRRRPTQYPAESRHSVAPCSTHRCCTSDRPPWPLFHLPSGHAQWKRDG